MVPESEEYGISSFVYHRHRPFVPRKIYDLMIGNFLLQERSDEEQPETEEVQGGSVKDGIAARAAGPFRNVLRSKGFMWLATRPLNMGEWSQAGAILVVKNAGSWKANMDPEDWSDDESTVKEKFSEIEEIGDRRNEIVFIGTFDESDRNGIKDALDACLVTDEQLDQVIKEGIDMEDPFDTWFSILSLVDQFKGRVLIQNAPECSTLPSKILLKLFQAFLGQGDDSEEESENDSEYETEDDSDVSDDSGDFVCPMPSRKQG